MIFWRWKGEKKWPLHLKWRVVVWLLLSRHVCVAATVLLKWSSTPPFWAFSDLLAPGMRIRWIFPLLNHIRRWRDGKKGGTWMFIFRRLCFFSLLCSLGSAGAVSLVLFLNLSVKVPWAIGGGWVLNYRRCFCIPPSLLFFSWVCGFVCGNCFRFLTFFLGGVRGGV